MHPIEALQQRIEQSELGQEWIDNPILNLDIWSLEKLGYGREELKIIGKKNIHFREFSLPWLKLLTKLTVLAIVREGYSVSSILQKARCLKQFDKFLQAEGYNQPELITDFLLQKFIAFANSHSRRKAIAYASKLWAEEQWLKLPYVPHRYQKKPPQIETIPEEVLHQIYKNFDQFPPPLERLFRLQIALGCRIGEMLRMPRQCLKKEGSRWFLRRWVEKRKYWRFFQIHPAVAELVREQQHWIFQTFGKDYPYLFCHFRSINKASYPIFSSIKPLPKPPYTSSRENPMVRIIRMLIEEENILDANKQKPHFIGKITRHSRLQEVRAKYGMEAAQLYADHKSSTTTFQHYAPPTREQIAEVDLPFQKLLLNPDNKFLPWQSLPESLLKNPTAHELDLEIAPRLVVYGHCSLNPKTPCPVNLFPKCYGCSSFRPSTDKLPLYERQYEGEQRRKSEAETAGAELAHEEAKATIEAMDKWLPELRRLANG